MDRIYYLALCYALFVIAAIAGNREESAIFLAAALVIHAMPATTRRAEGGEL